MAHKQKTLKWLISKATTVVCLSCVLSPIYAQTNKTGNANADSNENLLNQYVQSMGNRVIVFDASNIKQFWIDKTVISQDNSVKVLVDGTKSVPYMIQLVNVNEAQDCKVDIISDVPQLKFSVLNDKLKKLSESTQEDPFLNYNIASASFHLEDATNFSFYLQFSSSSAMELTIKKIILSFSKNPQSLFLTSPGTLVVSESGCTGTYDNITKITDKQNSFSATGKRFRIASNNKILVSDNTLTNSVSVKNTGDQPTTLYFGYIPYTKDRKVMDTRILPYQDTNKILNVVSVKKDSNSIVVDSEPEWAKGCFLALNAKEDLSDFPNYSFVNGKIQDVKKIDDNQFEIIFDAENKQDIEIGTKVRVQHSAGGFLYTNIAKLQPGEETTLSASVKKDDNYFQLGPDRLCRGIYYVVPVLLSFSADKTQDNTIQVTDFSVSY